MLAGLVLFLLAVVVSDFGRRRVPNSLVLLGALGAIAALLLNQQPFGLGWRQALAGGGTAFGALLLVYAMGIMGAGDVKFAGALGLWTGLAPLPAIWIAATLLAAVHALVWLALHRLQVAPRLLQALSNPHGGPVPPPGPVPARQARHLPLAAYLAIAALGWMAWHRTATPLFS